MISMTIKMINSILMVQLPPFRWRKNGRIKYKLFTRPIPSPFYNKETALLGSLFHAQIILYGLDPLNATCDFTRFIDGLLRINEAAQLNGALASFDTDLE